MDKIPVNLPNLISFYRIVAFPFILWTILAGHERIFAILLIINLLTDILDGWIARTFHMVTEFGAKLDSLGDAGTYLLAIAGIFVFKREDFKPYLPFFLILIGLLVCRHVIALIRSGHTSSLHLISIKVAGYVHGGFFIALFALRFYDWYFWMMIVAGYFAFTESILIHLLYPEVRVDARSLYHVMKGRNR